MTLTRGIALDCSCRDNPHIHDAALVIRVRLRQHAVYRLLHQRAAIVGGDDDANAGHTFAVSIVWLLLHLDLNTLDQ